ncbi:PPE domain-containing protein [Actinokineospora iranica]|uniref:PPE family protein n=1 Tax=Actinokineospora iranica TaxID=1271860 RepID=A0A1G6STA5_9PSEU|nr:PPE domain-containing protein [Actinokineospora iranica]SDD20170.1 PPE family protein [Actinokineospora iranica]
MTEQATDAARWRGFTHEELYRMLHDGPGAQASAEPSRRWAALSATLTEISQDLLATLDTSNAAWAGRAAGAAYDRLTPLAIWARDTATEAARMRVAVEDQGNHIAKARADMPAPAEVPPQRPDPTLPPPAVVAVTQTDAEPAEAARSAGEQKAFEVMAAYELTTATTLAALTGFTKPAELTSSAGLHRGRGLGVGGETRSSSAGGLVRLPSQGSGGSQGGFGGPQGAGSSAQGGHAGQGVGLSGAAESEVVRRSVLQAGGHSGAAPVNQGAPAAAPGLRSGVVPNDRVETRSKRPAAGVPVPADDLAATGTPGLASATAAGGAAPAGVSGPSEKVVTRRFGVEALGSSQWFGDGSVGSGGGRRRDLGRVTESVSVDGEDHRLPPGVIGG